MSEKTFPNKGPRIACLVCEEAQWAPQYQIASWDIWVCRSCRFAKVYPVPSRETRTAFYSTQNIEDRRRSKKRSGLRWLSAAFKGTFNKLISRDRNKIFYRKLTRYLPPEARILDVGCGNGDFLRRCQERFLCTGNDISEYSASELRKQKGIEFVTGDFLTAHFDQQKFDGLTMIALLEHLDNPRQVLGKCFDLLKEGGVLLLKTVNYDCWNRRVMKEKWTGFRPPDHLVYLAPSNLKRLLKKIGFSNVKISAWPLSDNMYCDAWKLKG